jgi:hypothetical protein
VIAAGPNALVYFVDHPEPLTIDAIEPLFPSLVETLSRTLGIGFVLARSGDGPVCFWRGKRYGMDDVGTGPFAGRADLDLVVKGIGDLMAMPSAGDLIIYGLEASVGHVSYVAETGAHAGPSEDEMHAFIIAPAAVTLPEALTHPLQLYPHFVRYQGAA